jgi:hypothetical protein
LNIAIALVSSIGTFLATKRADCSTANELNHSNDDRFPDKNRCRGENSIVLIYFPFLLDIISAKDNRVKLF